jgi:hypothetical protein
LELLGSIIISENEDGSPVELFQFDEVNNSISYDAPIGSFACDIPSNMYLKSGNKKTDWVKTTKRIFICDSLDWFFDMLSFNKKDRAELKALAIDGIKKFKRGNVSEDGIDFTDAVEKEFDFVGFTPNITYCLDKPRQSSEDINVIWQHPFSQTTLLYKHKHLPFLLISNGNIDYNNSRIEKNVNNNNPQPLIGISG